MPSFIKGQDAASAKFAAISSQSTARRCVAPGGAIEFRPLRDADHFFHRAAHETSSKVSRQLRKGDSFVAAGSAGTAVFPPLLPDFQVTAKKASLGGTWGEIGAGVSGQVAANTMLFASGAYQHSLDNKGRETWDSRIGVRVKW